MYARIKIIALFFLFVGLSSCQEKLMDKFEREAQEFSKKNCPQRYDDGMTILDSVSFSKDGEGTFILYYSLDIDEEQKNELVNNHLSELRDMNLGIVKNSVQFNSMKEAGVTFLYKYNDLKTGKNVVELKYEPKDYQ